MNSCREDAYQKVAALLQSIKNKKGASLALTGAGISTESGIPDFRSHGSGLWEQMDPIETLSAQVLMGRPKEFYAKGFCLLTSMKDALPNLAHQILARLEEAGYIQGVITQNIDNFHHQAGSRRVWEVHGNTREAYCLSCRWRGALSELEQQVAQGSIPPRCPLCGGIARPAVVLFGDPMPEAFNEALDAVKKADLLLVVGSSLSVYPVAYLPELVRHLVIINLTPTPQDYRAEVVLHEKASQALEKIYDRLEGKGL
ncbi:MAG: NAD-dependent deacylase [Treponemataceae bacterium]|nr:NAD-dependent deacylase [Treponemataceae bacterium]HOK00052.1 NAD-dependent deacylase [Termitinemataceae bacterium]HOM24267.1 NAD-dependent deacylase [Termitinemataceae bacterium]HPQ00950.1 NAD-dependent deacylase [Termitinemataceae bacterium]